MTVQKLETIMSNIDLAFIKNEIPFSEREYKYSEDYNQIQITYYVKNNALTKRECEIFTKIMKGAKCSQWIIFNFERFVLEVVFYYENEKIEA